MPRKKSTTNVHEDQSKAEHNANPFSDWHFVNIELSKEDLAALRDGWRPELEIVEWIETVCDYKFKFSITYDDYNECFIVTLSGTKHHPTSFKKSIQARGGVLSDALYALAYKMEFYCSSGDLAAAKPVKRKIDFG